MKLYHGTDEETATLFLQGELLDLTKANARKIDGPPGFFLATSITDAEFFALRRGRGVVIEFDVSDGPYGKLLYHGAVRRPIPVGQRSPRFSGDELMVVVSAFEVFNALLGTGDIRVNSVD